MMDDRIYERRVEVVKQKEMEMMKKYGWIVHYIFPTEESEEPQMVNIHTHGLQESYNHLDIQMTLPVDQATAHGVLGTVVMHIKDGKTFKAEETSDVVLEGFDVYFFAATEDGRDVLRIVLPDPNGKMPFDEDCEKVYNRQLEPTNE